MPTTAELRFANLRIVVDARGEWEELARKLDGKYSIPRLRDLIADLCEELYQRTKGKFTAHAGYKFVTYQIMRNFAYTVSSPPVKSSGGWVSLPEGAYLIMGWWRDTLSEGLTSKEARPVMNYATPAFETGSSRAGGVVDGLSYQRIRSWVSMRGLAEGPALSTVASAIWLTIMRRGVPATGLVTQLTQYVEGELSNQLPDIIDRFVSDIAS